MLLTIDAGNTNTVIGLYRRDYGDFIFDRVGCAARGRWPFRSQLPLALLATVPAILTPLPSRLYLADAFPMAARAGRFVKCVQRVYTEAGPRLRGPRDRTDIP